MSAKGKEFKEHVQRFLEELGVKRYAFGHTKGSHQEVRFEHGGRSIRFVFPGSPGDHRAYLNMRTELRKVVRSAERALVPTAPEARPVLDAGRVLPRKSHDMGGCRGRVRSYSQEVFQRYMLEHCETSCSDPNT